MPGQQNSSADGGIDGASSHFSSEDSCEATSPEVEYVEAAEEDSNKVDDKISDLQHLNEELSSEIKALKHENETFSASVRGLEKQVRESASKMDILVTSNRAAEEQRNELLTEFETYQHEKQALEEDKTCIILQKERLEIALSQAGKNISDLSKKVDDAESAAAAAKEKVENLEEEYFRLGSDNQLLQEQVMKLTHENKSLVEDLAKYSSENETLRETGDSLKALAAQTISDLNKIKQDRDITMVEFTKATEDVNDAKIMLERMRAAEDEYKAKISVLEARLASTSEQAVELEVLNDERVLKLQLLESRIEELAVEVRKEQELRAAVEAEVSLLITKKLDLEEEVKSALTTIQKMQEITHKEQTQRIMLEDQIANVKRDKEWLEDAKCSVEIELKNLAAASSKAAIASQAEILSLKQKSDGLEAALGKVKEEAHSSEKKVWQLLSEIRTSKEALESKSSTLRYALPSAVLSTGGLLLAGVFGYLRFKKNQTNSSS